MENGQTPDSRNIQQHLANERTFLAWIRTSITIVGLGFLAAGIVFRSGPYLAVEHLMASAVGIGSVLLGGFVMGLAARNYFDKQKGINNGKFRSPRLIILVLFTSLIFIEIVLLIMIFLFMLK